MMFHIGQKVVCVDNDKHPWEDGSSGYPPSPGGLVRKGAIYTVSNVYRTPDQTLMLELEEIYQPGDAHWYPGHEARSFHPVIERKTDISIFTAILNTEPEKIAAITAGQREVKR